MEVRVAEGPSHQSPKRRIVIHNQNSIVELHIRNDASRRLEQG
jgi:hypothetical protein